jgi:hydroxysqualene dehydroxylase
VLRVAVIGGGVAGIAAALEAAGRGASVTLFESMPHLGGRAAGVGRLDTGRHLVLSSYQAFFSLLRRLDSLSKIRLSPLHFTALDNGRGHSLPFHMGALAGPWAAGVGLIKGDFISPIQRPGAIAALARSLAAAPAEPTDSMLAGDRVIRRFRQTGGATVEDVFSRFDWPPELVRRLGHPLALAVGNASPDQLSAGLYLSALARVLNDSHPHSGWVAGEQFGAVLSEPAASMLPKRGVVLRLGEGVRWIERVNEAWRVVSGQAERFDRVVVTVPPGRFSVFTEVPEARPLRAIREQLSGRAIMTIRARVYGPVAAPGPIAETERPYGVWFREWHPEGGILLERVISNLDNNSDVDEDLIRMAFAQHAQRWFGARVDEDAITVRFFPDATMTLGPGIHRPALRQAAGLYYASDISATGLPATLESAARAGTLAGKLVAADRS